jgi:hypothetical protein
VALEPIVAEPAVRDVTPLPETSTDASPPYATKPCTGDTGCRCRVTSPMRRAAPSLKAGIERGAAERSTAAAAAAHPAAVSAVAE